MNNLMHRAVRRMDFAPRLEAAAVCQVAQKLARDRYRALSFREGTLKIGVTNYDDAAALRAQLPSLIADINQELAADAIKKITITVKPLDSGEAIS